MLLGVDNAKVGAQQPSALARGTFAPGFFVPGGCTDIRMEICLQVGASSRKKNLHPQKKKEISEIASVIFLEKKVRQEPSQVSVHVRRPAVPRCNTPAAQLTAIIPGEVHASVFQDCS